MGADGGFELYDAAMVQEKMPAIWPTVQSLATQLCGRHEWAQQYYGWILLHKTCDATVESLVKAVGAPWACIYNAGSIFTRQFLRLSYGDNVPNNDDDFLTIVQEALASADVRSCFGDETWT